jgi:hypothetical protein
MSAAGWEERRRSGSIALCLLDLVFGDDGAVRGVVAGVFGLDRQGKPRQLPARDGAHPANVLIAEGRAARLPGASSSAELDATTSRRNSASA